MSDGQPILKNPGSIGRRRFLKVTGEPWREPRS